MQTPTENILFSMCILVKENKIVWFEKLNISYILHDKNENNNL